MIYKGSIVKGNGGGSGDAVWGSITGTLSDQTDLETALAEKQDTLTAGSGIDITNNVISAIAGSISYDNATINENASNELQAIGIKEARTDTAIRIWHGNQAEYDVGGEINPYDVWYDWQKISAESVDFQSHAPFSGVAYGNGKFVITGRQTTVPLYSSDGGLTWNETDLPGGDYPRVIFGDGTFVTAGRRGGAAYSDDGEHWTQVNMTNGGWGLAYGDGVFIASSLDSGTIYRSTDKGRTWRYAAHVGSTLKATAYGDGTFVVVDCADAGSQTCAYSEDGGVNWNLSQMPSNEVWSSVAYGNGRFIATSLTGNTAAYSTDKGRTWTGFTLPYSAKWDSIIFDGNKFIVISGDSDTPFLYSYDGINWIQSPVNVKGVAAAYGNGKYIALGDRGAFSGSNLGQEFSFSDVYTSTATPAAGDSLYDSPNVVSALTITSVDTTVDPNTITLSDSSVYTYNEYGNIYGHYSVGESYPNYLCFIDGVGVKIGDTTIATYNSNS